MIGLWAFFIATQHETFAHLVSADTCLFIPILALEDSSCCCVKFTIF